MSNYTTHSWVGVVLVMALAGCSEETSSDDNGASGPTAGNGGAAGGVSAGSGGSSSNPGGSGGTVGSGGTGGVAGMAGSGMQGGSGGNGGATADAGAPDAGSSPDAGPADSGGMGGAGGQSAGPTFPPVPLDGLGEAGPYPTVTEMGTGPNGGHSVFRPETLGPEGRKHPVLTWGNGGATTPAFYPMLPHLASHGFVVVAAETPTVAGADLRAGLDWMLEQNEDSDSPYYQKLDPEEVAAFGYSLGSLASFDIGADPRLETTVHISGGVINSSDQGLVTDLHAPTAFFCDAEETKPNCDTDFDIVEVPTFYGLIPDAVHVSIVLDQAVIDQLTYAVTGWMRWHVMNDASMEPLFVGSDCALCTDPAWEVQKKNMN